MFWVVSWSVLGVEPCLERVLFAWYNSQSRTQIVVCNMLLWLNIFSAEKKN
jgi:hypothetical protein